MLVWQDACREVGATNPGMELVESKDRDNIGKRAACPWDMNCRAKTDEAYGCVIRNMHLHFRHSRNSEPVLAKAGGGNPYLKVAMCLTRFPPPRE